jgi:hypothetical protein
MYQFISLLDVDFEFLLFYEPRCIATIGLSLRRTLQLLEFFSSIVSRQT